MKANNSWETKKEKDLLLALRKNTSKGFEKAYDAYSDKLQYYIYSKIGDKKHSEDILQDVFLEFWNKIDQVESSVYGFIFHITKCQVLNYFRSARVRDKYIVHLSNFLNDINAVTPHKYVEAKEILQHIEQLVDQLPPQCRKVFIMSRFEHKSNDQIAEELHISKRTVENYISKGLAFIRENNSSIYLILTLFIHKNKF